ncbi:MAG TPA: helix-turn-helix domain-containing protein [Candidatus Bathyarchaeia archaeon]|nr:helix-turn-helix domain-containing protein [Candidatus Bathyarchaeia archaeon]
MDPKSFLQMYQDSLGHYLYRIGQLMREETNRVLQEYDLTPQQWQLLIALVRSDGLTPTELGTMTLRDKTTISRILPGLFKGRRADHAMTNIAGSRNAFG